MKKNIKYLGNNSAELSHFDLDAIGDHGDRILVLEGRIHFALIQESSSSLSNLVGLLLLLL